MNNGKNLIYVIEKIGGHWFAWHIGEPLNSQDIFCLFDKWEAASRNIKTSGTIIQGQKSSKICRASIIFEWAGPKVGSKDTTWKRYC